MDIEVRGGVKTIEQAIVSIKCNEHLDLQDARLFRGVFTRLYPNRPEFHGHGPNGLVYEHPKIQYKVVDGQASIVGLQEGAFLLQIVETPSRLRLGSRWLNVISVDRAAHAVPFGLAEFPIEYRFVTPWMALNEENHFRFEAIRLQDKEEICALLRRILIGNLLSMSKALGYEVPGPILAEVEVDEPTQGGPQTRDRTTRFLGPVSCELLDSPALGDWQAECPRVWCGRTN